MTSRKSKSAGLSSRITTNSEICNVRTVERFYYCAIVSILIFCNSKGDYKKEKILDINLHLLKWLEHSEKNRTWDVSIKNEISWIKRNVSKNPLNTRTLELLVNVYQNIQKINSIVR